MQITEDNKIYSAIPRKKTKKEFFLEVFKTGNLESFYDKELKRRQCERSKRRSAHELWLICKTEYPSFTLKELGIYLKEVLNKGKIGTKRLSCFFSYCPNIDKYTFFGYYPGGYLSSNKNFIICSNTDERDKKAIGFKSTDIIKMLQNEK